ncbi:MAG: RimK family alpha-L-glutamate ligase [Acholeplasmatales bacterium]|nr:RimK family alpha-L-glutamate ligase [Acholeplasmatales bacterium]
MDLWILYNISFMEEQPNPATRMYDEAIKNNIESKLMYYQLLKEKDNILYYDNEIVTELPKIALLRGNDMNVSSMLEKRGIKVINSTYTIENCVDKLKTHNICSKLNIKQIKTYHFNNLSFDESVKLVGLPFILKYRFGKQGMNIYIINNIDEYNCILKEINPEDYLLQEYIKTTYGKDVRVFIVGDKVVGACKRENNSDFKSNLAQGGLSYNYELTEELKNNSLKLKRELKGDIISVDYVFGDNELLFCEANTNPGFASFNYLGYPIRQIFMDYIKELLNNN